MKAMRKLVWMLLAVSMVGFTSCDSDDDDWIDDGGEGSGGSDEGGATALSGILVPVSSLAVTSCKPPPRNRK